LVELPVELIANRRQVARIELAFVLAANVPVQPDGQRRVIAAHGHRFGYGAAGDHEAGARHHTARVALQDAAVDAGPGTEVVGVYDKVLLHVASPYRAIRAHQSAIRSPTYVACSSVICGCMGKLRISRQACSVWGNCSPRGTIRS